MLELLWLIPALPLAGFVVLALVGPRLSRRAVAVVGAGSVGLAAAVTFVVAAGFLPAAEELPGHAFSQTLWTWVAVGDLVSGITLYLDALSLIMVLVVTFVGFLIHLYSTEYMADEEGYSRFFAYMNLFVASMLILVLADNLLLLLLGWEGVGLCSFLLIGFWYRDRANGLAARKAFIVTRIGDTALLIGIFLIFASLGTLGMQEVMQQAGQQWAPGSTIAVVAALLLLGGAVGKSAQLPLQTWLPDAMAGPTPVSALIHAATMVTAGVYLIARMNGLFALAPSVMLVVAIVGALTLLYAGFSALAQFDIKRVLAYSTISQIGYMFLALGVGAWSGAIFHFMTHAFFKALLFLGAGAVILAMHHEQDMYRMGGLRRLMPLTFWTFLIGAASLSALPLITAGYYSKDLILFEAWSGEMGNVWLWGAGVLGAFITAIYTFRMVFLVFYGPARHQPVYTPRLPVQLPLVALAILAVVAGFVETPPVLGHVTAFTDFLHSALPATTTFELPVGTQVILLLIPAAASLLGIFVAYALYLRSPNYAENAERAPWGPRLNRFWLLGWGFDALYDTLLVRPYARLAEANRGDFIDRIYAAIASLAVALHNALSATQSGQLRWYAAGIALGAVVAVAFGVFL
jgi:NADH-quinone oxidoreductase subunit L